MNYQGFKHLKTVFLLSFALFIFLLFLFIQSNRTEQYPLQIDYILSDEGEATQDLMRSTWTSVDSRFFNVGYASGYVWVRLPKEAVKSGNIIEASFRQLDDVRLLSLDENYKVISEQVSGDHVRRKPGQIGRILFNIEEDMTNVLLRIKTEGSVQSVFTSSSSIDLASTQNTMDNLVYGYVGLTLFALVFCSIWAIAYRDFVYIYFACMNATMAMLLVIHYKLLEAYIHLSIYTENLLVVFCSISSLGLSAAYVLSVIEGNCSETAKVAKLKRLLWYSSTALIPAPFIEYENGLHIVYLYCGFAGLILLASIFVYNASTKTEDQRWIVVGSIGVWASLIIGAFGQVISEMAIWNEVLFLSKHGALIGGTGMSLSLTILLVSRIEREKKIHEKMLTENFQYETELMFRERNAQIDSISRGLVHELKNPIAWLSSGSRVMLERKNDADIVERYASRNIQTLKKMDDILKGLGTYVAENLNAKECVFDLSGCLTNTLELATIEVDKYALIHKSIPDKLMVRGSETHLSQAIINLLQNSLEAIKASDKKDKGNIYLEVFVEQNAITILWSDDGKGMTEIEKQSLFNVFSANSKPKGNKGIGMFITKEIITRHNGTIEVESSLGAGAKFTIKLPN